MEEQDKLEELKGGQPIQINKNQEIKVQTISRQANEDNQAWSEEGLLILAKPK